MRVFVTGSTGLLGNNLVRQLLAAGHEVRGLVRSPDKAERMLGDTAMEVVQGDMRDVAGFADALDGCEAVCHTAAYFREYYQPGDHADAIEEINIRGMLNLLTAADKSGVERFIHVSSAGAIGMKPDGSPGDEDTEPLPWQLRNLYFKSKADGDVMIRAWIDAHEMAVIEILPGWMWGPGDAAPTGAGQMVLDFTRGDIPVIPGGGACIVDARDVAAAMIAALDKGRPGERYIVGGEFHTLKEACQLLEAATGVKAPRVKLPHAAVMAYAWVAEKWARITKGPVLVSREAVRLMHAEARVTSARAQRELDATFRPFEDTVRDVVAWYRDNDMLPGAAG